MTLGSACLTLLLLVQLQTVHGTNDWLSLEMPKTSAFRGFEAPNDVKKWNEAKQLAASGEQVLLRKVMNTVKNPMDYIQGKIAYKDMHAIADVLLSKASGGFNKLMNEYKKKRAPIVMFGYRTFASPPAEGKEIKFDALHPESLGEYYGKLPRKMVVIGA